VGMLSWYQKNGVGFTTNKLVWEIPGWTKWKEKTQSEYSDAQDAWECLSLGPGAQNSSKPCKALFIKHTAYSENVHRYYKQGILRWFSYVKQSWDFFTF
jgi:hypothetical protein